MRTEGIGTGKIIPIDQLRQMHAARRKGKEGAAANSASAADKAGAAPNGPDSTRASDAGTYGPAPPAAGAGRAIPSAADRARLFQDLKQELNRLPDVRRDKVIEAKLRISSGYYEKEEVKREILRNLLAAIAPSRASGAGSEAEETKESNEGAESSGNAESSEASGPSGTPGSDDSPPRPPAPPTTFPAP